MDSNLLNLHSFIVNLPADSIDRLRTINTSTSSSKHIILTLAYGLYDGNIRKLNKMITGLLLSRMKAEKAGKERLVNRINNFLEIMHEAIDLATGTGHLRAKDGNACKSTKMSGRVARAN